MKFFIQDLRFGFRTLVKSPAFTAVAVIALALGIGANSAIFSVVNAILLRPLPYPNTDRLVMIYETAEHDKKDRNDVSFPNFSDWGKLSKSFEQLAAFNSSIVDVTGNGEPAKIWASTVTYTFFQAIDVQPTIGRAFLPEEDSPKAAWVGIISDRLWKSRYDGDRNIIGKTIIIAGASVTVVGVMPPNFRFPDDHVDVWLPMQPTSAARLLSNRAVHLMNVLGLLKPGITIKQSQAEMDAISAQIQQANPGADAGHGVRVMGLQESLVGDIRQALLVLLGAVGFVLLIACANVANLQLSRGANRQREIAIRTALGAGRSRIIGQLLTESLLLSLVGGAAGLLLALWVIEIVKLRIPTWMPRAGEIGIDSRVLFFTLGISLFSGILFGLAPTLQLSKADLNQALKEGGRSSGFARHRLSSVMVVSEIALSLVLLIGAGLMIKSFWRLINVDPGFRADNLLTMDVEFPFAKYGKTENVISFYRDLPHKLETIPGIQSVSAVNVLPVSGGDSHGVVTIEGRPMKPGEEPSASYRRILPDYFQTMGIPLKAGREFTDEDGAKDKEKVVIIDETMSRRLWPGENPVGQRIKIGPAETEPWLTIVGVVGDVKNVGLDADLEFSTYEPHAQRPWSGMQLLVRTKANPLGVASAIRQEIARIDSDIHVFDVTTMDKHISTSVTQRSFNTLILGIFAAIALILAATGVYGVMAYAISQRVHEMGIRMALGANRNDVLKLVIGQGMALTAIGVVVGLAASIWLTRFISDLLFVVSRTDPATFAAISILLVAASAAACFIPALRATKVDPMIALRSE
ncbi:MAG TPA: ABC transporter permease [Blastocatellia bacterium]|nr:ABC transporter permease [Blastocatellia bacterium]